MKVGLIGEKLGHSFSKPIHEQIADYTYDIMPLSREEFPIFMENKAFDAINVTIPYKKTVMPYCAVLTETAARIGSVNTLVRREDGTEEAVSTGEISIRLKTQA